MTELTIKQQSFIEMMKEDENLERHGFEVLKSRSDIEVFFDALKEAGFFDPSKNPAPIEGTEEGFYQIPYWAALDYLKSVAVLAGKKNKKSLAKKVMQVIRDVSKACEKDESSCDNYHTFRVFAEIISIVPLSVITDDDIDLIPIWLKSRFDHGLVSSELVTSIIPLLLKSKSSDHWHKALAFLRHCTEINWIAKKGLGEDDKKPSTAIADHYLEKILGKSMGLYAEKIPSGTAELMLERLREVFEEKESYGSWLRRPAIEEHAQNHSFYKTENFFVVGLRETLLHWTNEEPKESKDFIANLISDQSEIVRRIAIYLIDAHWEKLKDIYTKSLGPDLFQSGHTHELYGLLKNNFENFSEELQRQTIEAIQGLPLPSHVDDPERSLKHKQRNWLSAVYHKGDRHADELFDQLSSDDDLVPLSKHPDFLSYSSGVITGFGDSPYEADELLAFIEERKLISKLNSFEQKDTWRGPTTRSLVDALEKTVQIEPQVFLDIMDQFYEANRPYQYGLINGFKKLWDAPPEKRDTVNWDKAWPKLVSFFERLISDEAFWKEPPVEDENMAPSRAWIPSLISDFIQSGTRDDKLSYSPDLLPKTWELVTILVQKSENATDAETSDAMSQAINTAKGRAIEAMINHALRNCRVYDKAHGGHKKAWVKMQSTFDSELSKCKNDNFEFSTLVASYIANFIYMDKEWAEDNFRDIFNQGYLTNYECALGGLAYAQASEQLYDLLLKHNVVDFSLKKNLGGEIAKEKLIERMALAYLWGTENIESSRFSYLFEHSKVSELTMISDVFRNVYEEEIPEEMAKRVIAFWEFCVSWDKKNKPEPASLMSSLSELSCYLKKIEKQEKGLLLAVAPHVNFNYNTDRFIEELYRLVDDNPGEVSDILGKLLESYVPHYDYEDKLKNLMKKLALKGHMKEAREYANKLQDSVPGMLELYKELINQE